MIESKKLISEWETQTSNEVVLTVDEAFELSGNLGIFQKLRLFEVAILVSLVGVFIFSLPFFERTSITCTLNDQPIKDCKLEDPCNNPKIKYIYNEDFSLIQEFDLLCDKEFLGWIGTAHMLLLMAKAPIFGYLSECIGRRSAICIGAIIAIIGDIVFVLATKSNL